MTGSLDNTLNMFKWKKSLDVVTLFHKANSPVSSRVLSLLKETSASASEQASTKDVNSESASTSTPEFELDVVEAPPTPDQLSNILQYVGPANVGNVVKGASDAAAGMKIFRADAHSFQRPVTVTWEIGKAVVGDNRSEILRMIAALPKNN